MNAELNMEILHSPLADAGETGSCLALDPDWLESNAIFGLGPLTRNVRPFLEVRSALLEHARSSGQNMFAVTSAEPGNGKTHVAANLAGVLSRVHATVLVELDMRRPSLGARLGLPEDLPGIDDYLTGQCSWADSCILIEGTDLSVHRVRTPRRNAGALLAEPTLALALRRLKSGPNAPICLIDTPSAIMSDDLVFISRCMDGALLVAEEGRSSKHALQDVLRALGKTPVIGSVLNRSISAPLRSVTYNNFD